LKQVGWIQHLKENPNRLQAAIESPNAKEPELQAIIKSFSQVVDVA
jgi:hypothetical protein